ncbi:MAG: 2-oxoglutarate dehydrogenase complex dihydrolipoyllysine-residue succinyltransferase [Candidatus Eisenbacteria bacterium]|uniref:Dihydrolipoamide acetyltransferase component of pyruvate dehydrogenase complex n=1 Tax=Eiseniibacteriota bacterium TaxID=2212470 RepID=A0A538TLX0_UNCEI|nr:MAG: 2-oxoglutarate dehydrogenase complex dihydrolipoyllysine-residue succinyltransferase [Candidatus Eisenbacteria bacterium]
MAIEIRVPRLAESISEAVLVAWLKPDGESVRADEPIATLETDKAAVEIAAEAPGVLRHARALGDTVQVGDVLARLEQGAGAAATPSSPQAGASEPAPAGSAGSPAGLAGRSARAVPGPAARPAASGGGDEPRIGPAVRRMAEEYNLDLGAIEGSGPGGRLLKEDVQRHVESRPANPSSGSAGAAEAPPKPTASPSPAPPPSVTGTSPKPAFVPGAQAPAGGAWPGAATPARDRIRLKIAERMVQAQRTAAILTTFNEVDMTAVMDLRARHRDDFERRHRVRLSYMSFFVRACVLALDQIPELNAEIREGAIVYRRPVHMGIAVGTERGLVVPVVRAAGRRSFPDLEREIARLASAARDNKLTLDELSGGTFSVSNGGVYGSLLSTPILNPPQSGILGMHKIEKRPVVVDDAIVIRPMMYLALSYDHRIVDGEQAVTFLVSVKQRLEDPERMLIEI